MSDLWTSLEDGLHERMEDGANHASCHHDRATTEMLYEFGMSWKSEAVAVDELAADCADRMHVWVRCDHPNWMAATNTAANI